MATKQQKIETEVYNPHNKNVNDLPVIYGFNGGQYGDNYKGVLLAEDGTYLGKHICSSEYWMLEDLGIKKGTRPDRHEKFREHYPDGYVMEFVSYDDVEHHAGLSLVLTNSKLKMIENDIDINNGLVEMTQRDNQKLLDAGHKLAIAAMRVVHEYDGLHRLSLAVAGWNKAVADQGDRDKLANMETEPSNVANITKLSDELYDITLNDYYEDGKLFNGMKYVNEVFNKDEIAGCSLLEEFYNNHQDDDEAMIWLLRILANLDYMDLSLQVVKDALKSTNHELVGTALMAIENWEADEAFDLLMNTKLKIEDSQYLTNYRDNLIGL